MTLVAGVDSSTQSCKVVIRDAGHRRAGPRGPAPHPDGTEVDPDAWWDALRTAIARPAAWTTSRRSRSARSSTAWSRLDADGAVVRPALLWNDTRSAVAGDRLVIGERRRPAEWAKAVGSVPLASFTVTKLRLAGASTSRTPRPHRGGLPAARLADLAARRRAGATGALVTDRGDASGTGYFSPASGDYRRDLLDARARPRRRAAARPRPGRGRRDDGAPASAPAPRSARAPATTWPPPSALGAGPRRRRRLDRHVRRRVRRRRGPGRRRRPASSPASPTRPATTCRWSARSTPRGCSTPSRACSASTTTSSRRLALSAPAGAGGLVARAVPRGRAHAEPARRDRRRCTASALDTSTPAHLARAAVEGLLCGLADGLDALVAEGARVDRVLVVGGGARSEAVRRIAPAVLGRPVVVPPPGEYVADGAARQAAWVLAGGDEPPAWELAAPRSTRRTPSPPCASATPRCAT